MVFARTGEASFAHSAAGKSAGRLGHSRIMRDAAGQNGYLVFSRPAYQCARIALGTADERQELKQSVLKRKAFRYYIKGLEKTAPVTMDHLTLWNAIQPDLAALC